VAVIALAANIAMVALTRITAVIKIIMIMIVIDSSQSQKKVIIETFLYFDFCLENIIRDSILCILMQVVPFNLGVKISHYLRKTRLRE